MNPAQCYCVQCRKPISQAMSQAQGVCDACKAANAHAWAAQARAQQAAAQPPPAVNTGRGVCIACHATNIQERWEQSGGSEALHWLAGAGVVWFVFNTFLCIVIPFFWIGAPISALLLLACGLAYHSTRPRYVLRRWCARCGHAWTV